MPIETLLRYEFVGARDLGDWFVLRKDGREARCVLSTHPLGWELRLVGGARDGFEPTQVCRTEAEVFDTAEAWKAKMLEKGWN